MAKITLQNLTASAAASRAIPSIQSPPPVAGAAVGPQSLYSQTITIPVGQKYPVMIRGDFVYIEGFTQSGTELTDRPTIILTTDTENTPIEVNEPDRLIRYPDPFNYIEFANSGAYTVYVTFWAGFGDIRRDPGRRLGNSGQASLNSSFTGALAAGQVVTSTPMLFLRATSINTQRARITKAFCLKSTAGLTNADFTLFLFAKSFATVVPPNPFVFPPAGLNDSDYLAQIRFPTFVTGGAGSTKAVCDLGGLSIDIYSAARDPNGYANGTIYGALVANAAYSTVNGESFTTTLTVEWD